MGFLLLLLVTLALTVIVSIIVIRSFKNPIDKIFNRIIGEDMSESWRKFLTFALFVVGVSSGVSIRKLERFIAPETENSIRPVLNGEFWGLEIYRTIIQTLGGLAWALLVFFVFALIAFVITKKKE